MKLLPTILWMLSLLLTSPWAAADNDEWEHRSYRLTGPDATLYRTECGSCHVAYPPRFLTTDSWQQIMGTLENHFGESAELEPTEQQQITRFLNDHAGSSRWYDFWSKQDDAGALPRITETRAFRHEHHEIPRRFIRNSGRIRSLSQCDACHTQAAEGRYSEHQIRIPGIGHWEDD